jgi:hypothetical protein
VRQLIEQLAGSDASTEVLDDLADELELVAARGGADRLPTSGSPRRPTPPMWET